MPARGMSCDSGGELYGIAPMVDEPDTQCACSWSFIGAEMSPGDANANHTKGPHTHVRNVTSTGDNKKCPPGLQMPAERRPLYLTSETLSQASTQ